MVDFEEILDVCVAAFVIYLAISCLLWVFTRIYRTVKFIPASDLSEPVDLTKLFLDAYEKDDDVDADTDDE